MEQLQNAYSAIPSSVLKGYILPILKHLDNPESAESSLRSKIETLESILRAYRFEVSEKSIAFLVQLAKSILDNAADVKQRRREDGKVYSFPQSSVESLIRGFVQNLAMFYELDGEALERALEGKKLLPASKKPVRQKSSADEPAIALGETQEKGGASKNRPYTQGNIMATIEDFRRAHNNDDWPNTDDGVIAGGPLANGRRKWEDVTAAFAHNAVDGLPAGTTVLVFMREVMGRELSGRKHRLPPLLKLQNVFNSVAWSLIKSKNIQNVSEAGVVEHGELGGYNLSWASIARSMDEGKVWSIPQGMRFGKFVELVKQRLERREYALPNPEQLERLAHH